MVITENGVDIECVTKTNGNFVLNVKFIVLNSRNLNEAILIFF